MDRGNSKSKPCLPEKHLFLLGDPISESYKDLLNPTQWENLLVLIGLVAFFFPHLSFAYWVATQSPSQLPQRSRGAIYSPKLVVVGDFSPLFAMKCPPPLWPL